MSTIGDLVCAQSPVGGNCHVGLKAPIVWIELSRPVLFQESDDPSFILAPMHSINWNSLFECLPQIMIVIGEVTGLDQSDFTVSPALQYLQGRRVAKPGIGVFTNAGIQIGNAVEQKLENALTWLFYSILQGRDVVGQSEIFPVEIDGSLLEKIAPIIDGFLSSSGGKRVGEARVLKTKGGDILVSGNYRLYENHSLPEPQRRTIKGEIDGLRGITRTVFVNIGDRKTLAVLFDEARFKEQLRGRVLDGLVYDFVVETEWIAYDKSVDTLVSYAQCVKESALD